MNWVFFAAFIVASSAAKLDRTYLPPASAETAGGSPGSLLTPLVRSEEQNLPIGSFVNEHDGVVVDVAPVGTRASQSGLGGPRISYGSTDSKVGEAAFRVPSKIINDAPVGLGSNPDLSAFQQQTKPSRTSFQISRDSGAHITKYHNDIDNDRYSYGFEADNGIKAEEKGVISNGVQAEGGFSYVGDDGKVYSVAYTADQNGYRPVGSHLPTPPPIPAEILKALEQNSRDEAAGLSEDGSYDAQKYNTGDYTKSDANGKYNDRQTIKFSIRPESSSNTGDTLINQNQGAFTKPNDNGALEGTKDNTNVESSKNSQHINGFGINFNNRNNFNQGQMNLNAGIGSRNEILQQNLQGFKSPNFESALINKDSSSSSIIPPKPLSQQELQESINSGPDKHRVSSYDTSFSTVVSDNVPSKLNMQPTLESLTRYDSEHEKTQPIGFAHSANSQQSFIKPTQGVFPQNFGNRNSEPELLTKPINGNIPLVSTLNDQNNSQNSFTSQVFNKQIDQNLNNRFSSMQSSTDTLNSFGMGQNTANDGISVTSSFFPATKQPERVLTTPFESPTTTNNAQLSTNFGLNREQYTGSNFASFPKITSTSKFPSTTSTQQEINTQTMPHPTSTSNNKLLVTNMPFSLSSQLSQSYDLQNKEYKPTENKLQTMAQFPSIQPNTFNLSPNSQEPNLIQSNQFNKHTQGLDTNYFYNEPYKPFNKDSNRLEIIAQKFPTTSADNYDSGLIAKQHTEFPKKNQDFSFTTYSQGTNGFKRPTNLPMLSPISLTTVSENKDSYQSNGITQASISSFPSIFPTSLNFKESSKISFNPFQQSVQINSQSKFEPSKGTTTGILEPSVTNEDNFNKNGNLHSQQYNNNIYEYNKPLQSFPSASENVANKQIGNNLGAQLTMTTPFRVNENRTSDQTDQTSYEMRTSSQFSKEDKILDRNTTQFKFQPSTQQFNDKLTTSNIKNPTDMSETQNKESPGNTSQFEIYEYTKPLQSLTSVSPKEDFNKNENRGAQLRKQYNKQSTTASTGSYTETMNIFQKDAQLTTKFDQEEFERKTEKPEFSRTSSTLDPSIYQYTKPEQSFITTCKQEYSNNSPLSQGETTLDVMSTSFGQQYSGAQEFGIPSFPDRFNSKQTTTSQFTHGNKPSGSKFVNNHLASFHRLSQQPLGNKFNSENQENMDEIYNYKKPNQTFSSSEQKARPLNKGLNSQYNSQFDNLKIENKESDIASLSEMLTTSIPQNQPNPMSLSTGRIEVENSQVENSQLTLQQNSQQSEIYEYSKPAQTLTTPVENNILGQNINHQFGQRFNQINSKLNIFNQNPSGDTPITQNESMSSPFMVTETNSNSENKFTKPDRTVAQTSLTSGINSKPTESRPQFTFHSACCRGFQTQKPQKSQFNQDAAQNTGSSDLKSNQNFEAQKLTTQGLISPGENFGEPRKPPSFDEKGYHY